MDKVTSRTLVVQEQQLKKIEDDGVLQETNRMLKMDKEKVEQELLQAQSRVRLILLMSKRQICSEMYIYKILSLISIDGIVGYIHMFDLK